uniref:Uncharacterized protein n=1 Tax=Ascaris lumbricoides TaxID=6252 RepID=A0A9J2PCL9_ASCLU
MLLASRKTLFEELSLPSESPRPSRQRKSGECFYRFLNSQKWLQYSKMTYWRSAGITYVRFSQLAAQIIRRCVKLTYIAFNSLILKVTVDILEQSLMYLSFFQGETKALFDKRGRPTTIKITKWEGGKPLKET